MKLFLIALLLVLTGCATKPKPPDAVLPPTERVVHLDPKILASCDKLEPLPESATWEDVLNVTINNYEKYAACARKQENSIFLLKRFSNYKEQ
jgi:hypothetical protein